MFALAIAVAILLVASTFDVSAQAQCTLKSAKSDWKPVEILDLPQQVSVLWRTDTSKAFGECLTEIQVKIINSGSDKINISLSKCNVDGKKYRGPSTTIKSGKSSTEIIGMVSNAPVVNHIQCDMGRKIARKAMPAPGPVVPQSLLATVASNDEKAESEASIAIVRHYLEVSFSGSNADGNLVSERIQYALRNATLLREEPGMAMNTQLRNAEYYLHGLSSAIGKKPIEIATVISAPLYNLLKTAVDLAGVEKIMRATAENPNSAPGGTVWAYRGLLDGFLIEDKAIKRGPVTAKLPLVFLYSFGPANEHDPKRVSP